MSADYGFDEEQHAQTNGDMDEGGDGLTQSNDAADSLNRAQTATRWTDEQGAQDFRNSAVRFFSSVDEMLADERAIFDTFQMNLTDAVREAVSSEEANASVLEAINRALQSDPSVAAASSAAGTASTPSAAPSAQPDDAPTAAGAMPEF
ncbi:MAG: hypothetical protein KH140_00100 [Actinomyces sp.]|nr:hypothetical protein [Actinomyces sp.]